MKPRNMKLKVTVLLFCCYFLTACASVIGTATGPRQNDTLVYAGTKLNISVVSKESCKTVQRENYGCAYDGYLLPLSLIDFLPSLAMDTLLLPFTALHAALNAREKSLIEASTSSNEAPKMQH